MKHCSSISEKKKKKEDNNIRLLRIQVFFMILLVSSLRIGTNKTWKITMTHEQSHVIQPTLHFFKKKNQSYRLITFER